MKILDVLESKAKLAAEEILEMDRNDDWSLKQADVVTVSKRLLVLQKENDTYRETILHAANIAVENAKLRTENDKLRAVYDAALKTECLAGPECMGCFNDLDKAVAGMRKE